MKTIIEKSKYLSLFAVVTLFITFIFALVWGIIQAVNLWGVIINSRGQDPYITLSIVKLIDVFLVILVVYILCVSIYKIFIGNVDLPSRLIAGSLSELKSKLSSVIILVMAVHFVDIMFDENIIGLQMLWQAIAISLVMLVLIVFAYLNNSHDEENS